MSEQFKEKEPVNLDALAKGFVEYTETYPVEGGKIKKEILDAAGLTEGELADEDAILVRIPLTLIPDFGTFCGRIKNSPFSDKAVELLKSGGLDFVLAVSNATNPEIRSMAAKMSEKKSAELSEEISQGGGSLRPDSSEVEGYIVFESE